MRVFVSHGSRNRWIAEQIARCVRDQGAEPFLDAYDMQTGDDIQNRLMDAVAGSDELLVLFTRLSKQRSWVWVEVGIAIAQGKRISAVLYDIGLKELERFGGARPLAWRVNRDLNEMDTYLQELKARCDDGR